MTRSIMNDSRSIMDDSRSIMDYSRSILDDSRRIIDNSRVTLQLVVLFKNIIYDRHIFIVQDTDDCQFLLYLQCIEELLVAHNKSN
jgi:hypothetical protein